MENTGSSSATADLARLAQEYQDEANIYADLFTKHPPHPELRKFIIRGIYELRDKAQETGSLAIQVGML